MTEKEIKRKLQDDGYLRIDVARIMSQHFGIKVSSAETMLHDLLSGRRWFPVYASFLKKRFGVTVEKPEWIKNIRERLKNAA
ncbi:hypothetical protein OFC37_25595 [Escherichia coli]|nr:hypothetical protein [Escherichia coli]